jgi:predicted nucleic acid-binding protein
VNFGRGLALGADRAPRARPARISRGNEALSFSPMSRSTPTHRIGANALLVEYGPKGLRPCDAIHLASAIRAECDCLLTWDKRFVSVFKDVLSPPMRVSFRDTIIGPYVPPSLFDGDE